MTEASPRGPRSRQATKHGEVWMGSEEAQVPVGVPGGDHRERGKPGGRWSPLGAQETHHTGSCLTRELRGGGMRFRPRQDFAGRPSADFSTHLPGPGGGAAAPRREEAGLAGPQAPRRATLWPPGSSGRASLPACFPRSPASYPGGSASRLSRVSRGDVKNPTLGESGHRVSDASSKPWG